VGRAPRRQRFGPRVQEQHGSNRSLLAEQIGKAPCNSTITKEEFIKIVTWIDANAPYYGTYRGKNDLKDKDHPDFRAMPLVGK